jgi:sugar O-acyltransferase (sialic acid O-acetyltransferase NeuD family)
MSVTPIHVIGAGGHAKVVIDILRSRNWGEIDLYDDDESKHGMLTNGAPVQGPIAAASRLSSRDSAHLAIGANSERARLAQELMFRWSSAIHPQAWISPSALVAEGAMVGAFAAIQVEAKVADHVIVNTGAIVEHEVEIGPFAHIAPGAKLGGGAKVGEGTLVGIGACILPNVRIGKWCRIGAGAVVLSDVADNSTVTGIPGRVR